jgi:phosphatidylglycerol:prolipoprotein diacylglycerol transferase
MRPILFTIGPVPVTSYAVFVMLAFIVAVVVRGREKQRLGIGHDSGQRAVTTGALLGAIVGSKLGMVLFADATMRDALVDGLTRFDFSGKTVIGGIVGGWIGVEIAKKWVGITTRTGDTYALALPLAIAVGRIGCHLNGCCYGSETELAFGVDLHGAHRHAAPLYEAVLDVGVAAWVYATRAWPRPSGHLFRESVIGLALARVLTEFVRGDPAIALGPFTAAQVVSALFATGLIVHVVVERTRARATRTSATLS